MGFPDSVAVVDSGDMLYCSCQEKNERLRNINDYNMVDNIHFPEHTHP
jgi:hypothetical protein